MTENDKLDLPILKPAETKDDRTLVPMSTTELTELETQLASKTHDLADTLLHNAMVEMEAALFERVSNELRQQLPHLIHQIINQYIVADDSTK